MRQLLYVSTCSREITPAALDGIIATSRANNALSGVTGLLLHVEGGFLQLLEGEERTVRELYGRIAQDRRHTNARLLLDREAARRVFTGWALGFERPSRDDHETAGLFGVTHQAVGGRLAPGAGKIVLMMLESFYRVQRDDDLRLRQAG